MSRAMRRLCHVAGARNALRSDAFASVEVAQCPVLDVTEHLVGAPGGDLATAAGLQDELPLRVARPAEHRLELARLLAVLPAVTGPGSVDRLLGGEVALVL